MLIEISKGWKVKMMNHFLSIDVFIHIPPLPAGRGIGIQVI
jgi:hypothetical protein